MFMSAVTQTWSDSRLWTKGGVQSLMQLWNVLCHEEQDYISSMTRHEIFTKDNFILVRLISCESSNKLREEETVALMWLDQTPALNGPLGEHLSPPFTVEKISNAELGSVNKN